MRWRPRDLGVSRHTGMRRTAKEHLRRFDPQCFPYAVGVSRARHGLLRHRDLLFV